METPGFLFVVVCAVAVLLIGMVDEAGQRFFLRVMGAFGVWAILFLIFNWRRKW